MRVHARFLIIGPRIHIGKHAVRNVHLFDRDRGQTMCGRTPKESCQNKGGRWFEMSDSEQCSATLRSCITCAQFTKYHSVNDALEKLR